MMTEEMCIYPVLFIATFIYILCEMLMYTGLGSSSSSHWEFMGNTMIMPEHIRLTPDLQSRQGAVWSRIVSLNAKKT